MSRSPINRLIVIFSKQTGNNRDTTYSDNRTPLTGTSAACSSLELGGDEISGTKGDC